MKALELKQILRAVPDDTDIRFELQTKIPDEELKKMSYPWPYEYESLLFCGYDRGYSGRVLSLLVSRGQEEDVL